MRDIDKGAANELARLRFTQLTPSHKLRIANHADETDLLQTVRAGSGRVKQVQKNRPALFRGRHFEDEVIILCVRWYLRYSLSYRDLKEMMAKRGLAVDHSTEWRWVQRDAPI